MAWGLRNRGVVSASGLRHSRIDSAASEAHQMSLPIHPAPTARAHARAFRLLETAGPGPGNYGVPDPQYIVPKNGPTAPFQRHDSRSITSRPQVAPGPGAYNVASMKAEVVHSRAPSQVQGSFKSGSNRFQNTRQSTAPGILTRLNPLRLASPWRSLVRARPANLVAACRPWKLRGRWPGGLARSSGYACAVAAKRRVQVDHGSQGARRVRAEHGPQSAARTPADAATELGGGRALP
jgi:hypothetical protein